ncbi:MAG: SurA N-terminal domain-containing protein [Rhodospirillales bacterium]
MLQSIRSKATSWVIKILFGILIVSFAIWGIGDILRGPGAQATVAQVGDISISAQELNNEFRTQIDRLRPVFGGNLDTDKARQLGLLDRTLDTLVERALMQEELKHLGVTVSEAALRRQIASIPAFRNQAGLFDPQRYAQALRQNNMTEAGFVATLRQDMARAQFAGSIGAGIAPPATLADLMFRHREEKRVADYVAVEAAAMPAPPAPDEAEARAFLERHKDRFSTPEFRSLEIAAVDSAAVMAGFKPDEAKLKESYEQRLAEFKKPERRHLLQMSLRDEDAAKRAREDVAKGKDFLAAAKETAGQSDDTTRLGAVARSDLPPDIAGPVFALAAGAVSEPVKTAFGWNLFLVEKIEPAHTETLEQARARLIADLAREAAGGAITRLGHKFEDERAGGASMAEAAGRAGLKLFKVAAVARDGKGPDDKPAEGLPAANAGQAEILKAAFEAPVNADAPMLELPDGGVVFLRVISLTPPAVKPYEQVKDAVIEAIAAEKRRNEAEKTAQAIVDKVKSGRLLPSAAEGRKVEATKPFTRADANAFGRPAPALTQGVFKLKPGEPALGPVPGGYVVAVLKQVVPADPAADKAASERVRDELRQAIANDIYAQLTAALRQRIGVDVKQSVIDQVFKPQ